MDPTCYRDGARLWFAAHVAFEGGGCDLLVLQLLRGAAATHVVNIRHNDNRALLAQALCACVPYALGRACASPHHVGRAWNPES